MFADLVSSDLDLGYRDAFLHDIRKGLGLAVASDDVVRSEFVRRADETNQRLKENFRKHSGNKVPVAVAGYAGVVAIAVAVWSYGWWASLAALVLVPQVTGPLLRWARDDGGFKGGYEGMASIDTAVRDSKLPLSIEELVTLKKRWFLLWYDGYVKRSVILGLQPLPRDLAARPGVIHESSPPATEKVDVDSGRTSIPHYLKRLDLLAIEWKREFPAPHEWPAFTGEANRQIIAAQGEIYGAVMRHMISRFPGANRDALDALLGLFAWPPRPPESIADMLPDCSGGLIPDVVRIGQKDVALQDGDMSGGDYHRLMERRFLVRLSAAQQFGHPTKLRLRATLDASKASNAISPESVDRVILGYIESLESQADSALADDPYLFYSIQQTFPLRLSN